MRTERRSAKEIQEVFRIDGRRDSGTRENAYDWQSLMFYIMRRSKEVRTKLDIMNDEFQYIHQYNQLNISNPHKNAEQHTKKLSRHRLGKYHGKHGGAYQ